MSRFTRIIVYCNDDIKAVIGGDSPCHVIINYGATYYHGISMLVKNVSRLGICFPPYLHFFPLKPSNLEIGLKWSANREREPGRVVHKVAIEGATYDHLDQGPTDTAKSLLVPPQRICHPTQPVVCSTMM